MNKVKMLKLSQILTFWILNFSFVDISFCHIVLTFPAARKYAFDFLDNVQTHGPCGVPKGLGGKVTDFQAGQKINVTWHIAYAHKGGYRLALLDDKEKVIKEFHNEFVDSHDQTKLYSEITLPDSQCDNCTLQLTRQAGEWSTTCAPGQYIFWSCADINVKKEPLTNDEKCGIHPVVNRQCQCRPPYSGHRCQYKDECRTDTDCNNGVCVETESTYFPKRQCYCNQGWFGSMCNKRSTVTNSSIDYSLYTNTVFSPEYEIYHRLLQEKSEIEVVMRVKSKNWVGLGWRPSGFRSGCQRFPNLPETTAEPEPEKSSPEPEPEKTTSEPEPEKTKGTPEPEPEKTTPEPEPEKTTPEPEPEKTKGTPEPEPEKSTPEPEPEKSTPEPEPEKTTAKPEPEPNACSNTIVQKCTMGRNTLDCFNMTWTFHEAKDTIEFTISAVVAETEWVGVGFSETDSMTNADIYYGWHSNGVTQMYDSHTGGHRASPIVDSLDLFDISGSRINGRTQLKFSRKRSTTEDQTKDVVFTDTKCYYILLAWGGPVISSTIGKHVYSFNNQIEKMCVKPCASPEPEPEKTTPEPEPEKTTPEPEPEKTKGTPEPEPEKTTPEPEPEKTTLEPEPEKTTPEPEPEKTTPEPEPEPNPCSHTIVQKCAIGSNTLDCFNMTWTFHEAKDTIEFTISAIVAETEWVGVGFSETDSMVNADIYYGWHTNGVTKMHDSHTRGYYAPPTVDSLDLFDISGSRINGRTQLKFSRKRSTTEDQTKDVVFTDTKCYYIILAWGGPVTTSGIGKHLYRFNKLKEMMCVKPCAKPEPEPETTATPEGEPGACGPAPGVNKTTGASPHSMDCVDMVIGSAKGNLSRIGDYYSRDRSTPQKDEFYGGKDDLTGALGFEDDDGFTTIVFRKKVKAIEPSDHSIIDEPMHVIWARGQNEDNSKQISSDGLTTSSSDPKFYKVDELKYHGHAGQRGTSTINFFIETTEPVGECKQEWGSCSLEGDCHHVEWVFNRILDRVHFTLRARLGSKQWFGLGFSRDKSMKNTDTVVAWIDNQGVVHVIDGWVGNEYGMPTKDPKQDIKGISGSVEGGITTISFNRARNTQDDKDIAFDGNDCVYFIFPKGGEYVDGTDRFTMHDAKPTVSQQKICIPCQTGPTQPPISTSRPAEKFWIVVAFKVTSIAWSDDYRNSRSTEFRELKWDVELSLNLLMRRVPGFSKVTVLRMSKGSIKIEAALEFDGDKTYVKERVETEFAKAIENGSIGAYKVDTNAGSYSIGDPEPIKEVTTRPPRVDDRDDDDENAALWAIVGVASLAFVVVIIFACSNYKKMHKKKEKASDDEFKSLSLGTSGPTDVHHHGNKSHDNKGLSVMNMAYEDWKEKNEAERVPSFKSSQNKYNIPSNNGMMETF